MPSMNKWCNNIHTLLKSIDMEDAWHNNELEQSEAKQWRSTIKAKIREREEMQWRDAMQHKQNCAQKGSRSKRGDDETERKDERTED